MSNVKQQPQAGTPSQRRFLAKLVVLMTGAMLLDGYVFGIFGPVTATMSDELSASPLVEGLIGAAALIGIFIAAPLGGWAADKFGRRPVLIADMGAFVVISILQFFP